jgi:hypothetical protein
VPLCESVFPFIEKTILVTWPKGVMAKNKAPTRRLAGALVWDDKVSSLSPLEPRMTGPLIRRCQTFPTPSVPGKGHPRKTRKIFAGMLSIATACALSCAWWH